MKGMLFVCMYVDIAAGGIPAFPTVMLVMTVVVTVAARRKTCFPTADVVIATKAEPSEDIIGFLYLFLSCPIP